MKCYKCNKEHDGSFGSGKYCSKSCANSRIFSNETKLKKSLANKGIVPWNKGKELAWQSSKCEYCGNDIRHRKSQPKKYHSKCWLKSSGGYRRGSGNGKSGWYKGVWCDSSYELVWVIYQLDHNLPFERNKKRYDYIWNGKTLNYIPDFIQKDTIVEIKGFINSQTIAKLNTIKNLKVLFRKDLNNEFEYVEKKYGKNFIDLYEGNPYKKLSNKCKLCGKPCGKKKVYCSRQCAGSGNNRNSKLSSRGTKYRNPK